MTTTTIRTFRHGEHRYRHVIDLDTDDVFLQRYNPSKGFDGEWQSLIRYDSSCNAWDVSTGKIIGRFHTRGEHWVFDPRIITDECSTFVTCEDTRGVESLLNSEVTISKRWLAQQASAPSQMPPRTDAEILDWLQRQHTLHRQVEALYVVDGYQVEITHDGFQIPGKSWHGETLREAYSKAMAEWDVTHGNTDLLAEKAGSA